MKKWYIIRVIDADRFYVGWYEDAKEEIENAWWQFSNVDNSTHMLLSLISKEKSVAERWIKTLLSYRNINWWKEKIQRLNLENLGDYI